MKRGVKFVGPWGKKYDGFNEHVRRCAVSLSRAGEEIELIGPEPEEVGDPHLSEAELLSRNRVTDTRAAVFMTVFDPQTFKKAMSLPLSCRRVFYTVFERDNLSSEDVEDLLRADQVWVACRDNAAALKTAGFPASKVKVVPCPYFEGDPLLSLRGSVRRPGPPRFYHIGKWEPRKAQDRIVASFMSAFRPGEAELYLRCGKFKEDSPPAAAVVRLLTGSASASKNGWDKLSIEDVFKSIVVVDRTLSEQELLQLHEKGDVYVSLSRGEGFDMPSFDSKLAGKRLVYTETAAKDFAGPDDIVVPRTGTVAAHPTYGWAGATYGDYRIEDACLALRRAAAEVNNNIAPKPLDLTSWTSTAVGDLMRRNLEEL